jgi:hypothetical protein
MQYRHCPDVPAAAVNCLLSPVQAIDPMVHVSGAFEATRYREPAGIVVIAIRGGGSDLVRRCLVMVQQQRWVIYDRWQPAQPAAASTTRWNLPGVRVAVCYTALLRQRRQRLSGG